MDKVKQYLELARKYHFWILCALSIVAGVAAWYLASGKLAAQFQQYSATISQAFTSLRNVSPEQPHEDWLEGIKKETALVAQDVKDAWTGLYKEQKEKIFVWPQGKDDLSAEFVQAASELDDPKAELSRNMREYYQRRVKQLADKLPGIIDAAPPVNAGGGGLLIGFFNPGAAAAGADHRIDWSNTSQQEIVESFNWTERPSTLLVKYAQEELWVYRALLNVIAAVNEGTTGNADAHITQILAFDIAYNAVEDSPGGAGQNRVEQLGNAPAAAGPAGPGGPGDAKTRPDPKARGKKETGGRFGFGAAVAADANPDDMLKNYRYVKADGTPQMKEDVDADTGEFRLMPFRMLLKMDGRYVDRLLVAFRNSVLPMEVQQVRINPEHTSSGGGGGFSSRSAGPGIPGGPGSHGIDHAAVAAAQQEDRSATVEIRGVVYLIQPPDPQKLPVAANAEAATAAPAAAAASTPDVTPAPTVPAPTATTPAADATAPPTAPPPANPQAGTEPAPATPPATNPAPPNP